MRILHVIPSYLPAVRYGGPIVSVHGLCRALVARGHDVHVFTTNVDGSRDSDVPLDGPVDIDGVKVSYFRSKHLRRLYWSPPMAKVLADRITDFEIAHLHSIFLWPTWAAARAARRAGVPYLLAPRGMLEKTLIRKRSMLVKSAWIALIDKRNLEKAAGIHVTSPREAAEAAAFGFNLPPVFEVPNGADLDPVARDCLSDAIREVVERGPFLLFLGRISWKKGLDRLIAALRHVPSVNLVVAGNDDERYQAILTSCAAHFGVTQRIVFVGPVHGSDKAALLKNAKALVLPSYSENFGNVVLEAMAAGCPVVVTPEVGSAYIVRQTGAGRVVQGQPETLAAALLDLLANPHSRRVMGGLGQKAVERRFTWNLIAERIELLYAELISRPPQT